MRRKKNYRAVPTVPETTLRKHPWLDTLKKDRLLIAILLAAAGYRLGVGLKIVDDAYITFRYADNLVAGLGFVYNPGQYVLGTSSPLFGWLLAAFGLVKISAPHAAFFLSLVATLITLVLIFGVMADAGLREEGYLACALYAIAPFSVTYAVSGMETAIYLLLVVSLLAFPKAPSWRVAVLGTLCMLCRPEGVLAVAVVLAARTASDPRQLKRDLPYFVGLGVPYLLFLSVYYGQWLPQSILAKAQLKRGAGVSFTKLFDFLGHGWPAVQTLLVLPAAYALRKKGTPLPLKLWFIWGAVYMAVFLAANAFTDFPWYFSPIFLVQTIAAGCGLAWVLHKTVPKMQTVVCACLLGLGLANGVRHEHTLASQVKGREALYKAVGSALRAQTTGHGVLAATEVGTLGYYYKGPMLDLVGLVSPEVIELGPLEALKKSRATYLVTYDTHWGLAGEEWFRSHYLEHAKIPVAANRNLMIYRRADAP